ncbi:carboxymethylenebutenolidase [Bradyrhizobium sp. LM3.6]
MRAEFVIDGQPKRTTRVGQDIKLTASDNFQFGAYRAEPSGTAKGAVVVIQEIFGVNHHIRSVCDRLAGEGYVAIAPSIFDRTSPGFQSGYTPDEIAEARKFVASPDWEAMLRDTQAAIDAVKSVGPVGIIGFCLGGSIAFVAATRLSGLKAAIGYYGGAVVRFADETPKVPTQLHFGEKDTGIPLTDVETVKTKRPDVEVFVYPGAQARLSLRRASELRQSQLRHRLAAQHGFFCQAFEIGPHLLPSFRDASSGAGPE